MNYFKNYDLFTFVFVCFYVGVRESVDYLE